MKWREWPKSAWGYWDHTPITVYAVMLVSILLLPLTIWFFVDANRWKMTFHKWQVFATFGFVIFLFLVAFVAGRFK